MVAAIFEAKLSREQALELASLLEEHRSARPAGVVATVLHSEGELTRLVAVWKSRDTMDRYLSVTPTPLGAMLMRQVGAEPMIRIADVLDYA